MLDGAEERVLAVRPSDPELPELLPRNPGDP